MHDGLEPNAMNNVTRTTRLIVFMLIVGLAIYRFVLPDYLVGLKARKTRPLPIIPSKRIPSVAVRGKLTTEKNEKDATLPELSTAALYPDDADIETNYACAFPKFQKMYQDVPDTVVHWTKKHPALDSSSSPCNRR